MVEKERFTPVLLFSCYLVMAEAIQERNINMKFIYIKQNGIPMVFRDKGASELPCTGGASPDSPKHGKKLCSSLTSCSHLLKFKPEGRG